jgi:hypothetical protein
LGHRDSIGKVGQRLGIGGQEVDRPSVGRRGFGEAAEDRIRAGEHQPALAVVGIGLQLFRQALDHGDDLLGPQGVSTLTGSGLPGSAMKSLR